MNGRRINLAFIPVAFLVITIIAASLNSAYAVNMNTSTADLPIPNSTSSGGFLDSEQVTFQYTGNYTCKPPSNVLLGNGSEVQNSTNFTICEVGAAGDTSGSLPFWVTIPAYGGLSIFGVPQLGASSQGFPMYANNVISTQCGAGGSTAACPDHPTYLYSPAFTAVEHHLGFSTGIYGLPEGVLPTPAHSHIVATYNGGTSIPWYAIGVLVLDPNIMPDAVTGKCTQVVPSNLTNATGNCLTSLAALQRAFTTSSDDVSTVNAKNPIYQTLAGNNTINLQVLVPGTIVISRLSKADSNLQIPFAVKDSNFYATVPEFGSIAPIILAIAVISIVVFTAKTREFVKL